MKALSYASCRRVSITMLVWTLWLAFFSTRLWAGPLSEDVPVPGGRSALSRALGLDPAPERARFVTELTRVIYDAPEGTSAATDVLVRNLANYLRSIGKAEQGAAAGIPIETVPVPLSARVWSDVIFKRPVGAAALFPAIITNRRAALLAYGLAALDDETLQFLTDHPALIAQVYEHDAAVFAAFAGSLRVRNGTIVLPGGVAAKPLWETVVDEPVTRPDRFIGELFRRDNGRVAYLYDALTQYDGPRRAFALGLWMSDPARRVARFKSLLDAVDQFPGWVVPERSFTRPPEDPVLMLMRVAAEPDGAPGNPSWRAFWSQAFDSSDIPGDPSRLLKNVQQDGRIDAAWLAESLLAADLQSRADRIDQIAFGLRAFAGADDRVLTDVLVAVRAFPRYRMLMLALERMGITNPAVYAAATRHAVRLSALDGDRAFLALSQFQSALAILGRLVDVRVLDPGRAEPLVASLSAVSLDGDGSYAGGIARWLQRSLALAAGIGVDDFDARLIAALAGVQPGESPARRPVARLVSWEQQAYQLDLTTPEARRLTRVLERLQAEPISLPMTVARVAEGLTAQALTLSDVQAAADTLREVQTALERRPDRREVVIRAIQNLSRIVTARDVRRATDVADSLNELVDDALADALISVAYALSLGDPQGTTLNARNFVRRHDFGLRETHGEIRARSAWAEPVQRVQPGVPLHVTGSVLGLDLGLSSLALRRTSLGALPQAPTLYSTDKDVFTKTIALMNMFDLQDTDRDVIVDAIARGRERIAALSVRETALDDIADEITMDGWRRRAVRWSLVNDPQDVESFFSLTEFLHLGRPPVTGNALDAWGMAASAYDGCICAVLTQPGRWTLGMGRWPRGTVATHVADLNLRVAVILAELKLPAALAKGVLASATQDYVDRVKPLYPDDWLTLVRSAQAVSGQRIQDYIAALTANGPLVPDPRSDSDRER